MPQVSLDALVVDVRDLDTSGNKHNVCSISWNMDVSNVFSGCPLSTCLTIIRIRRIHSSN
jgi:hypothetical protein